MKRVLVYGRLLVAVSLVLGAGAVGRAQVEGLPQPSKEHALLAQFAGEWDLVAETVPAPGQEAICSEGKESARMVGEFWLIGQSESAMPGVPDMKVTNLLTIGYDPAAKKYVGTFVCSMDSTFWKYEGTMDEAGKKLTLETTGPSALDPTQTAKYREVLELKDPDHKTFTSYLQTPDGNWLKFVTMDYRRRK